MARAIFSQVTVLAAFSGGSVSRASNQQTPSGWGAKFGQLQIIRYDRLLTSLLPFLLATTLFSLFWTSGSAGTSTRGALRNYTGDIELDQFFIFPAASAALAQGRSSLASRCTFSFWLCATSFSSSLPVVPFFPPKNPRVARTLHLRKLETLPAGLSESRSALVRLRKLDPGVLICIKLARSF